MGTTFLKYIVIIFDFYSIIIGKTTLHLFHNLVQIRRRLPARVPARADENQRAQETRQTNHREYERKEHRSDNHEGVSDAHRGFARLFGQTEERG